MVATMSDTQRLFQAANELSRLLRAKKIPHAFHGGVLISVLASCPHSDQEIYCIVEGGSSQSHPFRLVRDAVSGSEDFTTIMSPWTNRLHVTYRGFIPSIEIEVLPAGEFGPRHLDSSTAMKIQGVPFLTTSEFVRAKLKAWMISRLERDAQDICWVMTRYWNTIDINRIPEQDMKDFTRTNPVVKHAWASVQKKYRL